MPEPLLRRARPGDADTAVPLLVEALDALALELAGASAAHVAWPVFRELFVARDNRYSHEHVWVLDEDGVVVAAMLAYDGRREPALAAATLALLRARDPSRVLRHEPESAPDEYYLDALAVAPAQRGRGLAARLIEAACAGAFAAGHARVGLLVDEAKPGVKRLYQTLGFTVDGERMLAGRRHEHMARQLH
ncbi:GNAT family N-acetyltransferase [Dyella agri]|uniref:GNAT family N-acetyltransferase n=1 Tax=Dyella agri TaxID=1926869 RepID=A0ABW8KK67_9GAMM